MSIEYISDKELFHIKTKNSSYIFRLRKGYELEHLYYGERINDTRGIEFLSDDNFLGATLHAIDSEFTEEKLSTDRMLREYPFYGSVDLRCPAFHAEYRDGSRVTKMKYLGHKIFSGKPELDGLPSVYAKSDEAQTLEITMADSFTGLMVFDLLSENGSGELLYKTLLNDKVYGYAKNVKDGFKTLPELFNPEQSLLLSHNHHFFAMVDSWFYKWIAGIRYNDIKDRTLVIAPLFLKDIKEFSAAVNGTEVAYKDNCLTIGCDREFILKINNTSQRYKPGNYSFDVSEAGQGKIR